MKIIVASRLHVSHKKCVLYCLSVLNKCLAVQSHCYYWFMLITSWYDLLKTLDKSLLPASLFKYTGTCCCSGPVFPQVYLQEWPQHTHWQYNETKPTADLAAPQPKLSILGSFSSHFYVRTGSNRLILVGTKKGVYKQNFCIYCRQREHILNNLS